MIQHTNLNWNYQHICKIRIEKHLHIRNNSRQKGEKMIGLILDIIGVATGTIGMVVAGLSYRDKRFIAAKQYSSM